MRLSAKLLRDQPGGACGWRRCYRHVWKWFDASDERLRAATAPPELARRIEPRWQQMKGDAAEATRRFAHQDYLALLRFVPIRRPNAALGSPNGRSELS
jgi:hypothetical protein